MMPNKYTYLLVYSDDLGPHERVCKFLDEQPEILNWLVYADKFLFLVSERNANQLTDLFRRYTKDKGYFIILDTHTDRNGWLPKLVWEFMSKPRASWENE
jgi:hypothetical protein